MPANTVRARARFIVCVLSVSARHSPYPIREARYPEAAHAVKPCCSQLVVTRRIGVGRHLTRSSARALLAGCFADTGKSLRSRSLLPLRQPRYPASQCFGTGGFAPPPHGGFANTQAKI